LIGTKKGEDYKFNGNYGVHFRIWDKLFGTEFKDYEKTFDEIQDRKKGSR
jgi:sterol desaturase/sphingolipid hydroxylase (fatty acid hydroxylase superfamily)